MEDFPAAHSHDTLWFAVDRGGHVGVFWSGNLGHSPEGAENVDLEVWRLRPPGEEGRPRPDNRGDRAAQLGFFFYDFTCVPDPRAPRPLPLLESLPPYHLTRAPETPLHVDQLPPALRQRCKQIRFQTVDFTRGEPVQPMEEYACDYRYKIERVAYLCGDGRTVRPIPGTEGRFAEFCRGLREQHPEQAKDLIFEGPADEPPARGEEGCRMAPSERRRPCSS